MLIQTCAHAAKMLQEQWVMIQRVCVGRGKVIHKYHRGKMWCHKKANLEYLALPGLFYQVLPSNCELHKLLANLDRFLFFEQSQEYQMPFHEGCRVNHGSSEMFVVEMLEHFVSALHFIELSLDED